MKKIINGETVDVGGGSNVTILLNVTNVTANTIITLLDDITNYDICFVSMNEKTFIYDPNSLTGYFQITGFYTGASKETQSMFLTKTDNTHFKCTYAVTNSSTATGFKVSIKGVKF